MKRVNGSQILIPIVATRPLAITSETVSVPAGAAGTIKDFYFARKPILDSHNSWIGGYGDTSITGISTIFTNEVAAYTPDSLLANGDYWIDYVTGRGRGKKATTGTSLTVSYYVSLYTGDLSAGGIVDGDLGVTGDFSVSGAFSVGSLVTDTIVIDADNAEALLVRKNGDAGDVLAVDTVNSQLKVANGTSLLPSYGFINDPDTGLYRKAANTIGFVANAAEIGSWTTGLLTLASGHVAYGAGVAVTAGNYSVGRDNSSTNLMVYNVPTSSGHLFSVQGTTEFGVTAAGAFIPSGNNLRIHNLADFVTNTESIYFDWSGNIGRIYTYPTGTGTARSLQLSALNSSAGGGSIQISAVAPFTRITHSSTSIAGSLVGVDATSTASSGTTNFFYISPTVNQSGTAAFNALLINPTITAIGSGNGNFISLQTSSTERFGVRVTGDVNQAPIARTTGLPVGYTFTGAAHTGVTNSIYRDVYFNLDRSVQFTGGGSSIMYATGVEISPISFSAASAQAATFISTVTITGAAIAGSNFTSDIQSGLLTIFGQGKSNMLTTQAVIMPGIENGVGSVSVAAGYSVIGAGGNISLGNQTATLSSLAAFYSEAVTYESSTNVRTVTEAAGAIFNAPVAGTNVTFTSVYGALVKTGSLRVASGRILQAKGADVASANDLTIGSDGNAFNITGTTQVNAITTASWSAGSVVVLYFAGVLTVKHNTAGGAGTAPIKLSTSSDLTTAADTVLVLFYDGSSWQEMSRKVA